MIKRVLMMRSSKFFLAIVLLLTLVIIGSIPMISGRSSASEGEESHAATEAQGEHATAEEQGVAGEHGEEAAHEEEHGGEHAAEPWWKFPGWEAVFAVLACIYFLLAIRGLPIFIEDKSVGGGH